MNNRIREYRARHNFTQEELARLVNVRRETIVFLEKNKYNPSLKLAFDLARVFSVSIETLFFMEEDEKLGIRN
ncbi:MAG TPA: helix-turn-helix transcriptional regulator [Bacteroidales bacterium]|nr:helix-turn-helix transcriptional regulator [Lentimicrobiaceae bacterium]HOI00620.1 helix-turn-helix transcriptional regulator [Bacteroidales bacterium]